MTYPDCILYTSIVFIWARCFFVYGNGYDEYHKLPLLPWLVAIFHSGVAWGLFALAEWLVS